MVRRSKGTRSKTRRILKKKPRQRGLPSTTTIMQSFEVGEKAAIVIDPSIHRGQPHHRFYGETGTITGRQGKAYRVEIKSGNKKKILIVGSEHLKKQVS
jgi:large subunit ribosomal protein L21e